MLAEAVSLDGGALAVALAIVLVLLVAIVVVVVYGFASAPKAPRGIPRAMGGWIAALALEGLVWLGSPPALLQGAISVFALLMPFLVICQVALFLSARRRGRHLASSTQAASSTAMGSPAP
jgi:hypothetical protein